MGFGHWEEPPAQSPEGAALAGPRGRGSGPGRPRPAPRSRGLAGLWPAEKKERSQPWLQRARDARLSTFHCRRREGPGRRHRGWGKARLPRGHAGADRSLPADSAVLTPAGDGAGREARPGIKPRTSGPRAASAFSTAPRSTTRRILGAGAGSFRGGGGRDGAEPLAAPAQPSPGPAPGPSPAARVGRARAWAWAWAGGGARRQLSTRSRPSRLSGMSSAPAPGPAPACLTLWDEEDFQGRRCRLLSDCANISERGGLRRVLSVKVENGA